MKKEVKVRLVTLNIVLMFLVIGLVGYIIYDKVFSEEEKCVVNNENNNSENDIVNNDNNVNDEKNNEEENKDYTNFSGVAEITGYSTVEEITTEDNSKYKYVMFQITESNSYEFDKYVESLTGNSFANGNSIGIGCVEDNKIKYYNFADNISNYEYELSKENSEKILNSTVNNQIKLKIEKLPLTHGSGAPMCYSHITKIEVIN